MKPPDKFLENLRKFAGADARVFYAPGRVNLIGEHTDYNDGWVLPVAIDLGTFTAAGARSDRLIHAHSLNLDETAEVDLDSAFTGKGPSWFRYVEGVARIMEARGIRLRGADLVIESTVPLGSGLSSSAALEVSVAKALLGISNAPMNGKDLALACQAAEHNYAGIKSGIMDQYISVFGQESHALLIDCRSLEATQAPLALGDLQLIVCDTRVKHTLASSEYNRRREECERAVEMLKAELPLIRALRDVTVEQLDALQRLLPPQVGKRCWHVVTENRRTLHAVETLRSGEFAEFGRLMFESHRSLRDDYEVSCPELDRLVDTVGSVEGVLGARMTGGGFGGCTINLVHAGAVESFEQSVRSAYLAATGIEPGITRVAASSGACELIN